MNCKVWSYLYIHSFFRVTIRFFFMKLYDSVVTCPWYYSPMDTCVFKGNREIKLYTISFYVTLDRAWPCNHVTISMTQTRMFLMLPKSNMELLIQINPCLYWHFIQSNIPGSNLYVKTETATLWIIHLSLKRHCLLPTQTFESLCHENIDDL